MIHSAPIIYFASTADGIITEVSPFLCEQLNYAETGLVGKPLELILTIPSRIFHQTHFSPLLRMQGHAEEIFIHLLASNGEPLPVLINAKQEKQSGCYLYAGIVVHHRKKFEDELIGARKTAEKALAENIQLLDTRKQLQDHAEVLDRQILLVNKQKDDLFQFNRVVTHDLQEPVRKLMVFSNMILQQDDQASRRDFVFKIKTSIERLGSIVSGLQQYMWLTEVSTQLTQVDLKALLIEATEGMDEREDIIVHMPVENLPLVSADAEQIRFLFTELLNNAARFKKDDLPLSISISATQLVKNAFKEVPDRYKYEDYLKLEISDNGQGFDNIYKEKVFELFSRFHKISGLGIGLALCNKIVENHEGTIFVDSNIGEGTTITIWLPLTARTTS